MSPFTNILVRMPNWIGDLVMATAFLSDLKTLFPRASITAMVKRPLGELLEHDVRIDEIFFFSRLPNLFSRREEKRNIIAKIQAAQFDLGILLTNSFSSAWWLWQGKIPKRLGFTGHFRSLLLTDPIAPPEKKLHQVDLYKHLLLPLGGSVSHSAPSLYVDPKESAHVKKWAQGKKTIGIHPGASYGSAKCWPLEHFRSLSQKLLEDPDITLLFLGAPNQSPLIKQIIQGLSPRAVNLAGMTPLRSLVALIEQLDLLITNDSGPMHIADALKTPLIALFGSTDPQLTGPYLQKKGILQKEVSCSPCFRRECPIDFRCMKTLLPEEVFAKAEEMLQRRSIV